MISTLMSEDVLAKFVSATDLQTNEIYGFLPLVEIEWSDGSL